MKHGIVNSLEIRFSGIQTFMRMENDTDLQDADFVVSGFRSIPVRLTVQGPDLAQPAVREMSSLAAKPYNPVLEVDIFGECRGVDYGDLPTVPGYVEETFDKVHAQMRTLFESGAVPIVIGGDHSVTLPELRACKDVHGEVALIHFDAHYDTIKEYFGKPYSHDYHAPAMVDPSCSIQVGIREVARRTRRIPQISGT